MGTGHLFVDKLVKLQRARSAPGIDLLIKTGKINTSTVNFAVETRNYPKNTDWILELDLDESTGIPRQPFSVIRAYKIQEAKPKRGKNGRIEFWYCYTEERNFTTGKKITQRPTTPTSVSTLVESTASYAFVVEALSGTQSLYQVSSTYDLPIRVGVGASASDTVITLSPRTSPPEGKLIVELLDGTQTTLNASTI